MTRALPLPASPAELAGATWEDLVPHFEALEAMPLDTEEAVEEWLTAWSRLEELVSEASSLAMIAWTCDTGSGPKEAEHLRWSTGIMPLAEERSVRLARRLVDHGSERPDLDYTLRRFRAAIEVFHPDNVPILAELEELSSRYQRATGSMTAEWEGENLPLPRLTPFLQVRDRAVRERAWRGIVGPYVAARDDLAALFDAMIQRRQQMARNAGFANFRDYVFPAKYRFDYTPDDCLQFHDAIAETVVPALARVQAERGTRLGLTALRPWDLGVTPYRREPLVPYTEAADLPRIAARIFDRVDGDLGGMFRTLMDEELLDLESRRGKAPGGYCDTLHARGRPFIFMNAAGVMDDVNTLLHEAGHAFHAFASHAQPLVWQRLPTAESAELASMSMELLAGRHLGPPDGYLGERDAAIARLEHLEDVLVSLAHIASIDAFQHWIYTDPDGPDAAARDAAWLRIRDRFEPGIAWDGLTAERVARWYRQLHLFLYPFYYVEYAIAQVGALQVWRNSLADHAEAVRRYKEFLRLGAIRPLPELYAAAGVRLAFDRSTLAELVGLVEDEIHRLRVAVDAGDT